VLLLFMPGLAPTAAEWKRTFALLRGVEAAPRLGAGRPASLEEVERFIGRMPQLSGMSLKERTQLAADTLVAEAQGGTLITYRGEESDTAYFILKGSVGAGHLKDDEYEILRFLQAGDLFGEVAAMTGMTRTANVITEEACEFLIIPARVLKRLARSYPDLNVVLHTTIGERLSLTELPRGTGFDQQLLRELRTSQPEMKTEPASA
jgi:CRP-like cAMP-binding protein